MPPGAPRILWAVPSHGSAELPSGEAEPVAGPEAPTEAGGETGSRADAAAQRASGGGRGTVHEDRIPQGDVPVNGRPAALRPLCYTAGVWYPGSKILHPFNPELGVGEVLAVEGRFLRVHFPEAGVELTLAGEGSGLEPLRLPPGARARLRESGEVVEIAAEDLPHYELADGRRVTDSELWPERAGRDPLERLASQELDSLEAFRNRLEGLELAELREAGGLGSFLGGRIELFPHQLHTALRAAESDPVRWLLADEVGLGKTIEACLVVQALLRTGRAASALVLAPDTLAVQWLGELYRKFHQVFVLLDEERLADVEGEFGEGANPFELHAFAVAPVELLLSRPELREALVLARPELVVVDEAHRLLSDSGRELLDPVVRSARHALLLTATPLAADRRGFHHLLSLLEPDRAGSFEDFEGRLREGRAVVRCTSAVRRSDLGGLPPRVAEPVEVEAPAESVDADPRTAWLAEAAGRWQRSGEKALVFAHDRETVEALRRALESRARIRMAVFHEGLPAARRDLEVAAFRETGLPLLLSSDAGSEGRNFQFCDRLVLYDLPPDPILLEQRIGRLDRIGRRKPVEIVYFRPPGAAGRVARAFEALGLFEAPSAGLEEALAPLARALRKAETGGPEPDLERHRERVEAARRAAGRDLVRVAWPDAYRAELAEDLLGRVPPDLDRRMQAFCTGAAEELGFEVVPRGGRAVTYIELGSGARVEGLSGVPGGSRFLGTFDREEALVRDELDFFGSGHPLVEGLLDELASGERGRAAMAEIPGLPTGAVGLLGLLSTPVGLRTVAVDTEGRLRPGWAKSARANLALARPLSPRALGLGRGFAGGIRALGARLLEAVPGARLEAALFFRAAAPDA